MILPFTIAPEQEVKKNVNPETKLPLSQISESKTALVASGNHYSSKNIATSSLATNRILLVEDHLLITQLIQSILQELHCIVDIALTGQAALDKIMNKNYDLVFMDVGLPDKAGTEVTRCLRQQGISIPIIGLTGHAKYTEHYQACFNTGMNDVIVKPINYQQIKMILAHYRDFAHERTNIDHANT